MQHSVQKQGKFRYNIWRHRQLITHDTEPYVYMKRKTHPDSKKMSIEEVLLWPRYDKFFVREPMNSTAAARTVILRGRLLPLTAADLDFLAEAHGSAVSRRPGRTAEDATPSRSSGDEEGSHYSKPAAQAAAPQKQDTMAARYTSSTPHIRDAGKPSSCGGMSDDIDDDTASVSSLQPSPAGLNYTNPLVAVPSLGHSSHTSSHTAHHYDDDDEDEEEAELRGETRAKAGRHTAASENANEELDAHDAVGPKKSTESARMWVIRCPTLDSLRALVHALQGIDDYRGDSSEVSVAPVSYGSFRGSFEEVEEELRRVKERKLAL